MTFRTTGAHLVTLALTIFVAVPAYGTCGGLLETITSVVSRWVSRPTNAAPAWVVDARPLDTAWWAAALATGSATTADHLRFGDGAEMKLGPLRGEGQKGYFFCLSETCDFGIKLPKPVALNAPSLMADEAARARELTEAGFAVAEVVGVQTIGVPYLIKRVIHGRTLGQTRMQKFSNVQIDALALVYATGVKSKHHPDILGADRGNLIWDQSRTAWVLVDTGPETAPAYFQPFGELFRAGGRYTTTLMIYLDDVFGGDQKAALRFQATATKLLAAP